MSIRTRIAVIAAGAVAVAVVLVALVAFLISGRALRSEVDDSLIERANLVQAATRSGFAQGFPEVLRPFVGRPGGRRAPAFDVLYYQVVLPGGEVILPDGQPALPEVDEVATGPVLADAEVDGVHLRMVSVSAGEFGVVQIARPLTEVDATLATLAGALLVIGIVGTVVAGGIGYIVSRSAVKPIERLTEAAENVARTQDLDARIEVTTTDEVGRLGSSFNAMLAALEVSRDEQHRLVRDAGHELRTPLTALRTNIEFLAKYDDIPAGDRRDLLTAAKAEVLDLSVLVNEVVAVASDRYADEPYVELSLGEIAETSVERAERRSSHPIEPTIDPSIVRGRRSALARAVDNLLDNALKWSPDGTPVSISVQGGRVAVRDRGPGIDAEDRDLVFGRFYRAPEARSKPGSGLGLAIVKQIVDDHDGSVFVEEAAGGGAVVGFRLPLSNGESAD
jgi:two-component system sensor histidine kinase MprB